MREKSVFIKATLAKMKVFKGKFSKNKEGANVHPCNSFFFFFWGGGGQMSPMPFFMGVNRRVGQVSVGELS